MLPPKLPTPNLLFTLLELAAYFTNNTADRTIANVGYIHHRLSASPARLPAFAMHDFHLLIVILFVDPPLSLGIDEATPVPITLRALLPAKEFPSAGPA